MIQITSSNHAVHISMCKGAISYTIIIMLTENSLNACRLLLLENCVYTHVQLCKQQVEQACIYTVYIKQ